MCWSTVIAAADTHAAFGEAPDNGWVQRCRLGSGHSGIHASDAGVGPLGGLRPWLQWTDDDGVSDDAHRLTELESCPAADGRDLACVFFAGHGGPHRYASTAPSPRFGSHYRPDTTVSRNGASRAGSIATAESLTVAAGDQAGGAETYRPQHRPPAPEPELVDAPPATGRRSRHSGESVGESANESASEPAGDVAQWVAAHTGRVRPVDEVLLDLVNLLSELAAAIKQQREA